MLEEGMISEDEVWKFVEEFKKEKHLNSSTMSVSVVKTQKYDSFMMVKRVCELLRKETRLIIGSQSDVGTDIVGSTLSNFNVPHIRMLGGSQYTVAESTNKYNDNWVNIHPHFPLLNRAFVDLINHLEWKSMTLFYGSDEGLIKLKEILKLPFHDHDITVNVQRIGRHDLRPLLKDIKNQGESNFVVDCDVATFLHLLNQAQELSMVSHYYHYLFISMDLQMINLTSFQDSGVNITTFKLINPERNKKFNDLIENFKITTGEALVYDALLLYSKVLSNLSSFERDRPDKSDLDCNKFNNSSFPFGSLISGKMRKMVFEGLTGRVIIDKNGLRKDFYLSILELTREGLIKIGYWTPNTGVKIMRNLTQYYRNVIGSLRNKTLIVTTILEDPYVMLKQPNDGLEGNDKFEGYCVDLINEIAKVLKFNFTIRLVEDNTYGVKDKLTEKWSGIIGELINLKADLAVSGLTISHQREEVIDFTKPFMNLGISILYKKPVANAPDFFSFLTPLSFEVWIYMLATYIVVSFMLFVLARFSPYEWAKPTSCQRDPGVVVNEFTIMNSFWFTIGSLMQQGCETMPRANSTRILSGTWWFFALIMISSYTANLAAFLTVERMITPIENADDLSKQIEIRYGSVYGGSTMAFFRESKITTYERMWASMESAQPTVFVNSSKQGINLVKRASPKYAYLMESTSLEYTVQRECDLQQVGGLLDSKGYGIATPRNSPYRDPVSNAILKLQEEGVLHKLKDYWWKEKVEKKCPKEEKKDVANELTMKNVGGIFLLLVVGLIISLITVTFEFVWKTIQKAEQDRGSLCREFINQLKFAFNCKASKQKPPSNIKSTSNHCLNKLSSVEGLISNHTPSIKELNVYEKFSN
ncbi:unnamed protein product [Gordionus sp. m RMFG-2023]